MGWVCIGPLSPATGQDQADGADQAVEIDEAAPEGDASASASAPKVEVGSFNEIGLHVSDQPLTTVLRLLSMEAKRNIVASRNVTGNVSADFYGVDFYEALDAILLPNGYGWIEKGNFIYVYTQEELKALEEEQRRPMNKVVRLNYLTAIDASDFITPMLSASGSIQVSDEAGAGFNPSKSDGGANSFASGDTLVIRDYAENIEEIMQVLADLDVRPAQVLIETTILQARLTENNSFGVDLTIVSDFEIADFTNPLSAIDNLLNGTVKDDGSTFQTGVGGIENAEGGLKIGVISDNVSAFIHALDDVTDTTILANPKLLVLNRQAADLDVGQKLGYLTTEQTETSVTQTVEFLEIGTQLTVRPFVSDDGFIRLEINPRVSSGNTNRVIGTTIIPETDEQEMITNVLVKNGQTVVMGGLFKEDTGIGRRQVPGVGDVPILGAAFKGQNDDFERFEVIFLIKPSVVKDKSLYEASELAAVRANQISIGAREGLLPWSRQRLTNEHLRKAANAARAGDRERALWETNLALNSNPGSEHAQRLKEQLTGQRVDNPIPSVLQDTVKDLILQSMPCTPADPELEPCRSPADEVKDEADEPQATADEQTPEA